MRISADSFSATLPSSISPVCLVLLQSYLAVIDNLVKEIKLIEGRIRESLATKSNELNIISSVPGIGFIEAATLIADIDNIHDFENADKLTRLSQTGLCRLDDCLPPTNG